MITTVFWCVGPGRTNPEKIWNKNLHWKANFVTLVSFRTNMFKLNLGETPHHLTEDNFRDLLQWSSVGLRTNPRLSSRSGRFKLQLTSRRCPVPAEPCSPGDSHLPLLSSYWCSMTGAVEMTWISVSEEKLKESQQKIVLEMSNNLIPVSSRHQWEWERLACW